MADKRKLQKDIDTTLKKVQEGRTAFQEILSKYEKSTNQTQKEKFEADLKKEIKKLQRLRDQIKTWLTLNEIKDKRELGEARKRIESDMELFKVIEKVTKTKAYSKEGLMSGCSRGDPQLREREEMADWLRESIRQFKSQTEKLEFSIFSIESVNASGKKKRLDKDKAATLDEKKSRLEVCQFHIERLETTLRHFDNERIDVEQLKNVKASVDFFLETIEDLNFMDDRAVYDDLCLEELGDLPTITATLNPAGTPENEAPNIVCSSGSSRITTGDNSDYSNDAPASTKSAEDPKFDFTTSTPMKVEKPTKPKSAKDPANQTAPPGLTSVVLPTTQKPKEPTSVQPKNKPEPSTSIKTSAVKNLNESLTKICSDTEDSKKNEARKSRSNSPLDHEILQIQTSTVNENELDLSRETKAWPTINPEPATPASPHSFTAPLVMLMAAKASENNDSFKTNPQAQQSTRIHPKDAAAPFRNKSLDKSRSSQFPPELQMQLGALERAFNRLPNPCDTEKARMTICKNLCNTPAYYPKEPLKGSDTEEYFLKLDPQTLFFIFYYFEGTKAQYLAAKALKKLSWRFHTKQMMWFQRHEEPKQIEDAFESGTYICYDYKTMLQRKKEDFVFYYNFLEDKEF